MLIRLFHYDQASAIVNAQEVTRGEFPAGAYVSSHKITPDFFSDATEEHRNDQVKTGMRFLHTLIYRKIAHGMKKKDDVLEDDDDGTSDAHAGLSSQDPLTKSSSGDPFTSDSHIEGAEDDPTILAMDNLVFIKPTPANQAEHKLSKVTISVNTNHIVTFRWWFLAVL